MSNLQKFKSAWGSYRGTVSAAYSEYAKTVAALEKFQGSSYGTDQEQIASDKYRRALQDARETLNARMGPTLEAMLEAIGKREQAVVVPTDEQLRLLQAVNLMTSVSVGDYLRYSAMMGGSDVALNALHDLASNRVPEGVVLPAPARAGDAARAQLVELREAVRTLSKWDGSEDVSTVSKAGAIDPTSSTFFKQAVGLKYDEAAIQLLD